MLLDDSSGSKGRYGVVRPARIRSAQWGAELVEDVRGLLSSGYRDGGGILFLVRQSDSCKKIPSSGRRGEPPDEVPSMAKLALLMRVSQASFSGVKTFLR
ncbi:hypothetical protein B296_00017851 [Ensete ventricosum]|uniref:Uncharacterized protein n=1 Tax=Ensete ventricosum TaxID=4639 RepID=A0A427ABI2_ENSVE|nr:hypothetical protein B296_00017851 [Ensete ventricosum]